MYIIQKKYFGRLPVLWVNWRRWTKAICRLSSGWNRVRRFRRSLVVILRFGHAFGCFIWIYPLITFVCCKNTSSRGTRWKVVVTWGGTYLDSLNYEININGKKNFCKPKRFQNNYFFIWNYILNTIFSYRLSLTLVNYLAQFHEILNDYFNDDNTTKTASSKVK